MFAHIWLVGFPLYYSKVFILNPMFLEFEPCLDCNPAAAALIWINFKCLICPPPLKWLQQKICNFLSSFWCLRAHWVARCTCDIQITTFSAAFLSCLIYSELIKLFALPLYLLQGEHKDTDVVEERNAQVQLEKAKVLLLCCIMYHLTWPTVALTDSFLREAALKDMITSQTWNTHIRTLD